MTLAAPSSSKPNKATNAISPTRQENFPEWYQSVVKAADLAEAAPVRGCMVIKPYGFKIWKNVQTYLGAEIENCGVEDAYFPLLIPLSLISKEAEHVDGFAKECAVVTHHRLEKGPKGELVPASPLAEPMIIRPTSETIIGEVISDWVKSYRDLPLKLNQWCNVMRWEMRPRIFLRTAEFLWQEGHNCFATSEEATADALKMLNVYVDFLQKRLAIPGIKGRKTEEEKFPGASSTYTYESMMQDGKALQMCTSHDLGQTFSHGAGIQYLGKDGEQHFAHTTSWGMTTRIIGGLLMVHGDDDGAIMPPYIAPHAVRLIPIGRDEMQLATAQTKCNEIKAKLAELGISSVIDARDDKAPNKIWQAIKQGVPVRIEIGAREAEQDAVTYIRRDEKQSPKVTMSTSAFLNEIPGILADIHRNLYNRAEANMIRRIHKTGNPDDVLNFFSRGEEGFMHIPLSLLESAQVQKVRADFPVSTRCIPAEDEQTVILGLSY